jgi:hypothetical protein
VFLELKFQEFGNENIWFLETFLAKNFIVRLKNLRFNTSRLKFSAI